MSMTKLLLDKDASLCVERWNVEAMDVELPKLDVKEDTSSAAVSGPYVEPQSQL